MWVTSFDDETAIEPLGDGLWSGTVHESWNIGDNPNGGYLLSLVTAAMQTLGSHRDPLSITTHYLRPGTPGEGCDVRAEIVRSGRTLTTMRGGVSQGGKDRIEVLAAFGDLSVPQDSDANLTMTPPSIPPPDQCPQRSGTEQGIALPLLSRLDTRIHPDFARGGVAGRAEMAGWIRFADGRDPDTRALAMFADAFPPSVFSLLGVTGWVPTIELTVHVRRRPASGWVLGHFITSDLQDGRMIEDGTLWDATGVLVARSRQMGLLLN